MNIWKKPWFIPIVLTIFIVAAGQLYTAGKLTKAETLPEQEIRSQLSMIYDGEVKDLMLDGSVYKAKVSKAGAEYDVEVDAGSGKVLSLIQTKEISNPDIVLETDKGKETTPDETDKADNKMMEDTNHEAANSKETDMAEDKNINKAPEQSKPVKQEKPKKTIFISERQAIEIGLAQLPAGMIGEVDDVDFVNSTEGGYYLVQIEIDTEDDMDEVTYQIHAITGKVLTVTWDE